MSCANEISEWDQHLLLCKALRVAAKLFQVCNLSPSYYGHLRIIGELWGKPSLVSIRINYLQKHSSLAGR